MKKLLLFVILSSCIFSSESHAASIWKGFCDFTSSTVRTVNRLLYGQREEGADLIGYISSDGFIEKAAARATPSSKADTELTAEKSWVRVIKTTAKTLHGVTHLGAATCISLALADWCGSFADLDGGSAYWITAVPVGIWAFGATFGNPNLLPADIITDLADTKFSTSRKIVHTLARTVGTGASVKAVAWVPAVASAHKKSLCLENAWALRLPVAYGLAVLMAIENGREFARIFRSRDAVFAEIELAQADSMVLAAASKSRPRPYATKGWAKGWGDFRNSVGYMFSSAALVFTLYYIIYTYRGEIAGGKNECQERDVNSGLGKPNPLQDTVEFRNLLIQSAENTAVAMFVAAFTFLPWLYRNGRDTGHMVADYLQHLDPLALLTLGTSMGLHGLVGAAIANHFNKWGLKGLVPAITPGGGASIANLYNGGKFSGLIPELTGVIEQIQAATAVYASDAIVNPSDSSSFLANPSSSTKDLVNASLVLSMIAVTALTQNAIERVLRSILHQMGKKSELEDWLRHRSRQFGAGKRLLLLDSNIPTIIRDNLFTMKRRVEKSDHDSFGGASASDDTRKKSKKETELTTIHNPLRRLDAEEKKRGSGESTRKV